MATFEDFKKCELKIATILSAESVEKSDKLLKLQIEVGDEKRQLVAGIGKAYTPEELEGKQIIIVANLDPREIMGIESQGMLLTASDDGTPVLLMLDKEVPSGLEIN